MNEQILQVVRGTTFSLAARERAPDGSLQSFAGLNAKAQVREHRNGSVILELTSDPEAGITIDDDAEDGYPVKLTITAAQTLTLAPRNALKDYVMDLLYFDNGSPQEVTLGGYFTLRVYPIGTTL